jgi:hypothetical protein
MTIHFHNDRHRKRIRIEPYEMLGAGKLVSTLWKTGDQQAGWRYHFNLFRMTDRGHVGQRFSPDDLVDLIKLARVLAATLADDGCLSPTQRRELARLAAMLDQIISRED